MVIINKREVRIKKKRSRPVLLMLLLASLFGIFLVGMYFGLFDRWGGHVLPFIYEEIYSSSADLNESIKRIDYSLYETLFKGGVQEKDVFFLDVHPIHRNGCVWDFAEILVRCRDKQISLNIQKSINQNLTALGKDISLKTEKGPESMVTCYVFAKTFQTHKVVLSINGREPSHQNSRPKIAIIIDDLGYDPNMDDAFLHLDLDLSYSVLPHGPFTQSIVRKINEAGSELLLHLPMEPKTYPSVRPGPGALFRSMDQNEIRQALNEDLSQINGVQGVNNHMGSSFTEDKEKMHLILKELKEKGLFFVDSRTTEKTVAFDQAREMGVPTAQRRVFLDHNLDAKAMKIQMERLLNMARHKGMAIGIGHPYKETLELLKDYRAKIKSEFLIVPVSELVG